MISLTNLQVIIVSLIHKWSQIIREMTVNEITRIHLYFWCQVSRITLRGSNPVQLETVLSAFHPLKDVSSRTSAFPKSHLGSNFKVFAIFVFCQLTT